MDGICAVSPELQQLVIAIPSKSDNKPAISVHNYQKKATDGTFNWYQPSNLTLKPHRRPCGAICINRNGSLVASAPLKAKKVKIFSTTDGALVLKVSRGAINSMVKHITFSYNSEMLSLTSSDKQTVHVWRCGLEQLAHPEETK